MTKFAIQNAPHLKTKASTFKMMMEFFACLVVLLLTSVIFYCCQPNDLAYMGLRNYYGWYYGLKVLGMGVCGILFSVLADAIFYLPSFWKDEKVVKLEKGQTRLKKYIRQIIYNYSYVTGLLVALLLPVGTPIWVVFVTSFGATFVFKNIFGGFGGNIFNPAVIGRVFAQICFSEQLVTYLGEKPVDFTIQTGASITGSFSGVENIIKGTNEISTLNMFIGNYYGTLGETFFVVLLVIFIYLAVRKIIDWRLTISFVVTFYVSYLLMGLCAGKQAYAFEFALRNLMAGGAFFGAVLCLTDPVTSPVNRTGKIIFGCGSAVLTMLIRMFTNSPEGMAYSIIIMNMLTPLIDRCIYGRTTKHAWKKYTAISVLPLISIITSCVVGAQNYTAPAPKGETYVVENVGSGFGTLSGTVTINNDKVVGFEITEKGYTIADEGGWMEGKPVDWGSGEKSTEAFYNTFVKGIVEGDGISFDVFKNASSDNFISGCTQFSNGFIDFINDAINQHESK